LARKLLDVGGHFNDHGDTVDFNPGLRLDQSLQQGIAPQMQQSLRILQAPTLELQHLVNEELSLNPVLEDETPSVSLESDNRSDAQVDAEIAMLARMGQEWSEGAPPGSNPPATAEDEERHQFVMDSLVSPTTLQSHLEAQITMATESTDLRRAAADLVGDLDERGYQRTDLEELSMTLGTPLRLLREAREILTTFDPPGVGARDLRECLLLQLEQTGQSNSLEYRIVESYLDDLARKRFSDMAKQLGVHGERVREAAESISQLNPVPGSVFQDRPNPQVRADVLVFLKDGEWHAELTNESIPRLRISSEYKELLAESGSNQEVRAYLREKIRSGKFLIRAIESRQDTVLLITRSILRRQKDFFDEGPDRLKPMVMASIAKELDVHETTISRAVNGKYMRTPHGFFELRAFFSWGYEADDGSQMSNVTVKSAISEMIRAEDPAKPLSDQKIVDLLKEKGIPVARRTVAKYRDALHILPSHLRKSAT